jgi:hypothetical protein
VQLLRVLGAVNFVLLLSVIASLLLLTVIAWVVTAIVSRQAVEAQVIVGIASAGALVLAAVIANVNGKIEQSKIEIARELRDKRNPIYYELIELIMEAANLGNRKKLDQDALTKRFGEITPKLILWASDEVMKEWAEFRTYSQRAEQTNKPLGILLQTESLLYAIRRDLGYSGKSLYQGDLLSAFINDIHQEMQKLGVTSKPLHRTYK